MQERALRGLGEKTRSTLVRGFWMSDPVCQWSESGDGGHRAVLTTSQYIVELDLQERQLPELKRWLASKGAVETEGFVELSEVLRR